MALQNFQGANLQTAVDWLIPYALKEKKWDYQQIGEYNASEFYPLLLQSANKFHDKKYLKKAGEIKGSRDQTADLL